MAQKSAFIIDQDRDFALSIAAVLKGDGLRIVIHEGDKDPIEDIRAERPDIVLVRAELEGRDNGFSLCSRVKRNKRLQGTIVFLYTQTSTSETIATHRTQETRADDYLMLPPAPPFPFDDIKTRVRTALSALPVDRPPALPRIALEGVSVPAPAGDDPVFVDKVLSSIPRTAPDEESTSSLPRTEARGGVVTTADKKLLLLRQELRQREVELAKMGELYRSKEREYHAFNERLVEKDVEAQSLRMTIEEISGQAEALRRELERRTVEFNGSFEQLLEDKVMQEKELIEVLSGKEKELYEARGELANLDHRTKAELADLEGNLMRLGQQVKSHVAQNESLTKLVGERERTISELESRLETVISERGAIARDNAALDDEVSDLEGRIVSLARSILELRTDLAETREKANAQAVAFDAALVSREQVIEGLKVDIEGERTRHQTAAEKLQQEIIQVAGELGDARARHKEAEDRGESLAAQLAETERSLTEEVARLGDSLTERGATLDAEREQRAAIEEALETEIAKITDRFDTLQEVKNKLDQTEVELTSKIQELTSDLEAARRAAEARATELQSEIDRIDGQKLTLEQELSEREQDLAALNDARSEERGTHLARIASLETALAQAGEREKALNHRKIELESELDDARVTQARLEEQNAREVAALDKTLAEVRAEMEGARFEAEEMERNLRSELVELGTDIAEKGDKIDQLTRTLELESEKKRQSVARIAGLDGELRELHQQLDTTRTQLETTRADLGQTRETLALREGRLAELSATVEKESKARTDRETELAALRHEHDQRGAELGRLGGRFAAMEETLTAARRDLGARETKLEDVQRELFGRQSDLATARAEANERGSRLEDLARQIQAREKELATERQSLAERVRERDLLEAERDQGQRDTERLTEELAKSENEVASMSQEKVDLEVRIERLTDEVHTRDERLEGVRVNLKQVEDARSELDRARLMLAAELARTEEARERLAGELERARGEWTEARAVLSAERDAIKARMAQLGEELDSTREARDDAIHAREIQEEQARARAEIDRQAQEGFKRQVQGLERDKQLREDELRQEMEVRDGHTRSLDQELARLREALAEARRAEDQAEQQLAHLTDRVDETRAELESVRTHADEDRAAAESRRAQLEQALQLLERVSAEKSGRLQAELQESRRQVAQGEQALASEREENDQESERLSAEIQLLRSKLEDASGKLADLRAAEAQGKAEIEARGGRASELTKDLERERAAHKEALARAESRASELASEIESEREEREALESRHLKELEDVNETHAQRMEEKETTYRKELEELRNGALDAKRQLKAAQLAGQRLTERVQKLETERPSRSGAEEDFEQFMRQYQRKSQPPLPPGTPGANLPTARPAPLPVPPPGMTGAALPPPPSQVPPRPSAVRMPHKAPTSPPPPLAPPHRPRAVTAINNTPPPPAAFGPGALSAPAGTPNESTDNEDVTHHSHPPPMMPMIPTGPAMGPRARQSASASVIARGKTTLNGAPDEEVSAMLDGLFADGQPPVDE